MNSFIKNDFLLVNMKNFICALAFMMASCSAEQIFTNQPKLEQTVWPQAYFFDTFTDHFDNGGSSPKFSMRYLVDETYWDPATGPILFYAGNEGDIYGFYDNSGFIT